MNDFPSEPNTLAHAVKPLPPMRRIMVDILKEGHNKHKAWGFFEIDVTEPRRRLKALKDATGDSFSFTAFLLWCTGKAIDDNKEVHAVYRGKEVVIFDHVDISTLVERTDGQGKKIVASLIVRSANKKTFREINEEIRRAQRSPLDGELLGDTREARLANFLARLPRFLRIFVWLKMRRDPFFRKKMMGTVNLSAVGMFLPRGGFAMTYTPWPMDVIVGGMARRPAAVGDKVEIREFLDLVIGVDHDAIDGAPAARCVAELTALIEKGEGLTL